MTSGLSSYRQSQTTPADELQAHSRALSEHLELAILLVGTLAVHWLFLFFVFCFLFFFIYEKKKTLHCTQVCLNLQGSSTAPIRVWRLRHFATANSDFCYWGPGSNDARFCIPGGSLGYRQCVFRLALCLLSTVPVVFPWIISPSTHTLMSRTKVQCVTVALLALFMSQEL